MSVFARRKSLIDNVILAVLLPAVAGAVNASGFLVVGSYTSHVTGSVARIGDELAQGRMATAVDAGLLVLAFLLGTMTATLLVIRSQRLAKARYVSALMLEGGVLACFAMGANAVAALGSGGMFWLAAMLSFAMGLQNALVTKISGAVVRTTHLTGVVTDIGMESVRAVNAILDRLRAGGVRALSDVWELLRREPELKKLRLHLSIFGSFLVGALAGPFLYLHYGPPSLALPCLVLMGLIGFDLSHGIQSSLTAIDENSRQPASI